MKPRVRSAGVIVPEGPMALVGGAYEGATRRTNDLIDWVPSTGSADQDILPSKELGDARARDLARNEAYVNSGHTLHKDSIVGDEYRLNVSPAYEVLRRQDPAYDETWVEEFQIEVESMFRLAAEGERRFLDAKGTKTLTEMVRLAVGLDLACGEVLATAEWIPTINRPFRTAVQMVEVSRLSTPFRITDRDTVRGGVKRDTYGRPLGYYIRKRHPYDYFPTVSVLQRDAWTYVPASKPWGRPQVLHAFEEVEAGQTRGVNVLMSAMRELRIMKQFRPIQLQNAITQATFAASIESDLPSNVAYEMIGAKNAQEALTGYVANYLGALETYADGANNMKIDGVKIPHLLPGSKLNLQPAGANGQGVGTDFEASLIRYLAAALGVSYEELSRDYTQTNYSSARAAMLQTWKHLRVRKKRIADRLANFAYGLWLEEQISAGRIQSLPRNAAALYYEGLNREAFSGAEWLGAARGQIDELKETEASVLRVKENLSTYEDEMARQGRDWRQVLKQRARENAEFARHGLPIPQPSGVAAQESEDESDD